MSPLVLSLAEEAVIQMLFIKAKLWSKYGGCTLQEIVNFISLDADCVIGAVESLLKRKVLYKHWGEVSGIWRYYLDKSVYASLFERER